MYFGRNLSVVGPSETRDLGFDYLNDVGAGETLSSATFTLAVEQTKTGATADPSPSSRLSGSASIEESADGGANTVAVQRVTGCVDGNRYRLTCHATTNLGQILRAITYFWCLTDDPQT